MKFLIILNILSLLNCHHSLTTISNNPFEGVIEYDIKYPNQSKEPGRFVTVKFRVFYKEGNIRKEYLNKNDSLLLYTIYLQEENIQYAITPDSDTVEYYKPDPQELTADFMNVDSINGNSLINGEKVVLGYSCKRYDVKIKYSDSPHENGIITYNYLVAEDLFVDNKNMIVYGSNIVFPLSGHIILKYTLDFPALKVVEAKKVILQNVDGEVFKLDFSKKVLIKI